MAKEQKNIVAMIYLKDGKAVQGFYDDTPLDDVFHLAELYNDNGIDKLIVFDLSDEYEEHEKNVQIIKNINRSLEIKVCAGGNINRMEDIKDFLFAGCLQVILNGSKPNSMELANEASSRFGKDRILVSVENVDFIFKHQENMNDNFHELLVLNTGILDAIDNMTDVPYVVYFEEYDYKAIQNALKRPNIRGIAGRFFNDPKTNIIEIKSRLSADGIKMDNYEASLKWEDLKKNSDGMVPVIVQDYRTDEVLMLAYMTREAFDTTIHTGKMTYYSRSRQELWVKGMTSGHVQYMKSLTTDCDFDTILAKVSQVGAACHTGNRTCFFNNIIKKEYLEKNPMHVFEDVYNAMIERKEHPKEGSFANYLLDQGLDAILKQVGEQAVETIIAAKNPKSEDIRYEISDMMYDLMVLMAEKEVTWEDITQELVQR